MELTTYNITGSGCIDRAEKKRSLEKEIIVRIRTRCPQEDWASIVENMLQSRPFCTQWPHRER